MPTSSRRDCSALAINQLSSTMRTRKPRKRDAAPLKESSTMDNLSTHLVSEEGQGEPCLAAKNSSSVDPSSKNRSHLVDGGAARRGPCRVVSHSTKALRPIQCPDVARRLCRGDQE